MIVPELLDNVPSTDVLVPSMIMLDAVAMFPLVSVSVLPTVMFAPSVMPLALLMVRLLKVELTEPLMLCDEEPLNVTMLVDAVNVPLFVMFPLNV